MKRFIIIFLFFGLFFVSQAQEILCIEMNNNKTQRIELKDIRQMTFKRIGSDPSFPVAEAIDLGLPSGTKWASWNIGASAPEDYGGHYAWGEIEEKDIYNWSTYNWCNDSFWAITKYTSDNESGFFDGLTELLPEDDVATWYWGAPWHIPTIDQFRELYNNCTLTLTQQNGNRGLLVIGPNGNTIFLPATGFREDDTFQDYTDHGNYWSSTRDPYVTRDAYTFNFDKNGAKDCSGSPLQIAQIWARYCGLSVRPVCP